MDAATSTACCGIVAEGVRIDVTVELNLSPGLPEIEHKKFARGTVRHVLENAFPFI